MFNSLETQCIKHGTNIYETRFKIERRIIFFPILIPIQFIIIYISFYTKIHSLFNNSIIKVFFLRKKKKKKKSQVIDLNFKKKIIDATFF